MINLWPAGEGQDWVLTYTPERRDESDQEKALLRLFPRALHELYIEMRGLSADDRMAGRSTECALCGDQVDLDEVIPDGKGDACHRYY